MMWSCRRSTTTTVDFAPRIVVSHLDSLIDLPRSCSLSPTCSPNLEQPSGHPPSDASSCGCLPGRERGPRFLQRSSRHFVIVAVACREPRELRRMMWKSFRRGSPRAQSRPWSSSSPAARRLSGDTSSRIARADVQISWCSAVKSNIPDRLRHDKTSLYLGMCGSALSDLSRAVHARSVHVVVDRMSNSRTIRGRLDDVVVQTLNDHHCGYFAPRIVVSHLDSAGSAGIQVADFVAGAVFQGLERPHTSYLDLISGNVVSGRRRW